MKAYSDGYAALPLEEKTVYTARANALKTLAVEDMTEDERCDAVIKNTKTLHKYDLRTKTDTEHHSFASFQIKNDGILNSLPYPSCQNMISNHKITDFTGRVADGWLAGGREIE